MSRILTYRDTRGIVVKVEGDKYGRPVEKSGMIISTKGTRFMDGITRLNTDIFYKNFRRTE